MTTRTTLLTFAVILILSVCSVTSQYVSGCGGGNALGSPYAPSPIIIRSNDSDRDMLFPILLLLLLGGGGFGGYC